MATIQMYTRGDEDDSDTTGVVVEQNEVHVITDGGADDWELPANAPIGFQFVLANGDADVKTVTGSGSDTITTISGNTCTTMAQGEYGTYVRSGAAAWLLIDENFAADV